MDIIETSSNLIDTAIGPVTHTASLVSDFDIDDYVHTTVRAQGIKMMLVRKASTSDARLAAGRTPVEINDVSVGGF